MKQNSETLSKINYHYVSDDCVQIMMAYRDYLLLFGNNDVMYFKNLKKSYPFYLEKIKNVYLSDERKESFPYSQIPEHIERRSLFQKMNFTNQILNFERPYVRVNDGLISKMEVFKDGQEAIVHRQILNDKLCNKRCRIVTSEEFEKYLDEGSLTQLDENDYQYVKIFDINGTLYNSGEEMLQTLLHAEKEKLARIIDENEQYDLRKKTELFHSISMIDHILPFVFVSKVMVKFKQNHDIKIDVFEVKYLGSETYEIRLADLPVTRESLSMIKQNFKRSTLKTMREPKINLSLIHHATKEQLKILMRSRY